MAEPDAILSAHEKYGLPLSFSRDGSALITGGFDGTVSRWSVKDWSETASMQAHDKSVNCGAITSEDLVVTGSTDMTVRLLDSDISTEVRTLTGHKKTVAGLASHPSEPVIASASYDATVRVWQSESQTDPIVLTGHPNNVTGVEFIDRGDSLVSGGIGDELIVWNLDSATEETRLDGHGQAVAGIATYGDDRLWSVGYNGTVFLWFTDDWSMLDSFDLPSNTTPSGIAVNPDSEHVAVTRDGGVLIFDAEGRSIAEYTTGIKGISMPRWGHDGSILAVGGADGNIRIYDPESTD
jgi:cytochrome c